MIGKCVLRFGAPGAEFAQAKTGIFGMRNHTLMAGLVLEWIVRAVF